MASFGGGAHRDPFDPKDQYYIPREGEQILPALVDLRQSHNSSMTPVYDQGYTESCTANAAAAAFWYEEKEGRHTADWANGGPSRRFIYWLARGGLENGLRGVEDTGTYLRKAIAAMSTYGVCSEEFCQFPDFDEFDKEVSRQGLDEKAAKERRISLKDRIINAKPDSIAFEKAMEHKITKYQRLDLDRPCNLDDTYYLPREKAFSEQPDGTLVLKDVGHDGSFARHTEVEKLSEHYRIRQSLDPVGHSFIAIGCDDAHQHVIVQNSWGAKWSKEGIFRVPYAWISDFAATFDFWTIRVTEDIAKEPPVLWEELQGRVLDAATV